VGGEGQKKSKITMKLPGRSTQGGGGTLGGREMGLRWGKKPGQLLWNE